MHNKPASLLLESIAVNQPVADPYFFKLPRGKAYAQIHIFRQVGNDWFKFTVNPVSNRETKNLDWQVSSEAVVNGNAYSADWQSDRADLVQMFWLSRHGLKRFLRENGQNDMPPVEGACLLSKRKACLIDADLPASLLLELYRVNSPNFGYGGAFSFNEHNVCINTEKIHMQTVTSSLTLRLAQSPLSLLWGFSKDFETKRNGYSGSSSPLVSGDCRYPSRQEAIFEAASEFKRRYADDHSLIDQINKTLIGQTMQLRLF